MMIIKTFPKKLPSKIRQYAESLEILSAFESWESRKMHLQFGDEVTKIVELFLNDMISSCFAVLAVGANVLRSEPDYV